MLIFPARFDSIQPDFGPVAGGTLVNITGHGLGNISSYLLYFAYGTQSVNETIIRFDHIQ